MTYLVNNSESFAAESLEGFCRAFSQYVQPVNAGVVRVDSSPKTEVSVVVGGGSGHYPAFLGWVGSGMAHGAVAGNIFASPSASQVCSVIKAADNGSGAVVLFGNYAGDVLHFGDAAEQLRASGNDIRVVPISDDIASNSAEFAHDRRGIAGDLFVVKIAGAAAAQQRPIDEVEYLARKAVARTRSLGVAFTGCTLPGASKPLFKIETGKFELGLGIHGEQGLSTHDLISANQIAELLTNRILAEEPIKQNGYDGRVAVLVNGLGATKYEELFVLYAEISKLLTNSGHTIVQPIVGEQVTSLDMAGVSLSLMFLDEQLEQCWIAPADTPAFHRSEIQYRLAKHLVAEEKQELIQAGSAESAALANCLAQVFERFEKAARQAEVELGRIDAVAGDGDHGQAIVLGSTAAARSAAESIAARAGVGTLLVRAGAAWSQGSGGTSGSLWGGMLTKIGTLLSDEKGASDKEIAQAVVAGARSIQEQGGAKIGDKTMVDAVLPFAYALEANIAVCSFKDAWTDAAEKAMKAAVATSNIVAKRGRAKTHGQASLGTPDPGCISFAMLMATVFPEEN